MFSRVACAASAADMDSLTALAQACDDHALHVVDLPYRLSSWATDEPENVCLWRDGNGQPVAWAVMQTPFWTVDFVSQPSCRPELLRDVLAWANARAWALLGGPYGHSCWFAMVLADKIEQRRALESAGWACQAHVPTDAWSKVLLRREAGAPLPEARLPAGYALRPLAGAAEVDAYVAVHRAVFGTSNMTVTWRARVLRQPTYRPDLDLVAVAPDGQLAGFCVGWLGHVAGEVVGQVEPLGVHPEHRRRGLGRALVREVLGRLYALGAAHVLVETDAFRDAALSLYEAVGFRAHREVLVYRKDWAPAV